MLTERMQVLLQMAYAIPTIGEEHHLLVLLHALRFQQFPEASPRFVIKHLDKAKALARRDLLLVTATELQHALPSDHFKEATLVCRPHETTIKANREWAIRQGLLFPVLLTALEQHGFLLAQIR